MSFNYLQSIISGEVEDSQIASSLEKHKYMINLPPFDPDAYIDEKKSISQIGQDTDQTPNNSNKNSNEKPLQNMIKQDDNETFEIDNSTQIAIMGLIISIFVLVLILAS